MADDTIRRLVAALRFLAAEGLAERRRSYPIDVWDAGGNEVMEHIGSLSNHAATRAAFTAACEARYNHEVTLRQGIRVAARQDAGSHS